MAVEIASRRVTVASVGRGGDGLAVSAFATEPLPAGAINPALTATNITNAPAVVDALRRALDRAGLRAARKAALIVPDSIAKVALLSFEQLPARQAELDQLIRWQLKKTTPFPIDDASLTHFVAQRDDASTTLATIVARRDIVSEYEAVVSAAGLHAGIVDLASVNVMNSVIASGAASSGDWLLVHLASEATTVAIGRGASMVFYRHRTAIDKESLSALVHQTAMYHQDRLGGSQFAQLWISGADGAGGGNPALQELTGQLGVPVELVDVRRAVTLRSASVVDSSTLDALAAPVGVLLRERRAA